MTSAAAVEAGDLAYLEAQLLARFSQLHPDLVRCCLRDSMAEFEGARVRTYLTVLIERAATDRLRALERASADDPNVSLQCPSTSFSVTTPIPMAAVAAA